MSKPDKRHRVSSEVLLRLFALYVQYHNLAEVGRHVGLTRERVRQLLVQGDYRGLFSYKGKRASLEITADQVSDAYLLTGTLDGTARRLGVSKTHLQQHWPDAGSEERLKNRFMQRFWALSDRLGRPPNYDEIKEDGLSEALSRYLGTVPIARDAAGMPPNLRETLSAIERLLDMRGKELLVEIPRQLSSGGMTLWELMRRFDIDTTQCRTLLELLIAKGKVVGRQEGAAVYFTRADNVHPDGSPSGTGQ